MPEAAPAPRRTWITGFGLSAYNAQAMTNLAEENVYLDHAPPAQNEANPLEIKEAPYCRLMADEGIVFLTLRTFADWSKTGREIVTAARLGQTAVSQLPYENYDGQNLVIDTDYFGRPRTAPTPAGPFSQLEVGEITLKVWPH